MKKISTCSEHRCRRPVLATGLCVLHYTRKQRFGHTGEPAPVRLRRERLWWIEDAASFDEQECLIWPYGFSDNGYGVIRHRGRTVRAHRLVLSIATGSEPEHLHSLHSCCNRACCNPNHLRWGTDLDNTMDKFRDNTVVHGEAHYKRKLTADEVRAIYCSPETMGALASTYGVSKTAIFNIKHRRTWRRVLCSQKA